MTLTTTSTSTAAEALSGHELVIAGLGVTLPIAIMTAIGYAVVTACGPADGSADRTGQGHRR